jgi:dTDP-4-amino-4,6-dideoxygalactose transaminase
VGRGGVLVSDDDDTASRVRLLRSHALTSTTWDRHRGHADSYDVVDIGFNFRIDEPRAALALARLPRLSRDVRARRAADGRYRERLQPLRDLTACFDERRGSRAAPLAFPVLTRDASARVTLAGQLGTYGIETTGRRPLRVRSGGTAAMPRSAAQAAERLLVLPLHAWRETTDQDLVLAALAESIAGGQGS